jgi:hypothetical protein
VILKLIAFSILAFFSILTVLVLGWSFGWHFPMFIVILIPVIIMHGLACIKAYRNHPRFTFWILLSAFALLAFSLFRTDVDAQGSFSGYSALLYYFGVAETAHTTPWKYSLEVTLTILLVQIFISTYILRSKVNNKR